MINLLYRLLHLKAKPFWCSTVATVLLANKLADGSLACFLRHRELGVVYSLTRIITKLKEALTNTGASHHSNERSLSDGGTSFIISVPA